MDNTVFLLLLFFCGGLLGVVMSSACDVNTCKLPECFCQGRKGPRSVDRDDIPQMVMLTFDDAVLKNHQEIYQKIFTKDRTNPNGCPLLATFFVCHNWTEYNIVNELYLQGHEMASHSKTHRLPQAFWTYASYGDWENELEGQRDNIHKLAGVPRWAITGARAPYLETGGDAQFQMMTEAGYVYDSSFMTGPFVEGGAWPFTLDYSPSNVYCSNINCPKRSYPKLWEIPLNRWVGPDGRPCPMMDVCDRQPKDKADAKSFFMKNFNRHYRGNRAPFGMHLHAPWLVDKNSFKLDAFVEFLDEVLTNDDVYLITLQQVISWMTDPQPKHRAKQFSPWKTCNASPSTIPSSQVTRLPTTLSPTTKDKSHNSTRKPNARTRKRLPYFTRPKASTTLRPNTNPKLTSPNEIEKSTQGTTTTPRLSTSSSEESEKAQLVEKTFSSADRNSAVILLTMLFVTIVTVTVVL